MRILIMMNYGGGTHASAAQALAHEFRGMGHHVDVLDVDHLTLGKVGLLTTAMYGPMIRYSPQTFDRLASMAENPISTRMVNEVISTFIRPKLTAYFRKHHYDCIISVNPFYLGSVANLRRSFAPAPIGVVILDLANVHPIWYDKRLQFVATPSPVAQEVVLKAGINPDIVGQFGIPLRSQFLETPPTKTEARHKLHLPADKKVILIGGNLEGAGSIHKITQKLLNASPDYHLVAVCGKNGLLYRQLSNLAQVVPNLTVYKRIDFMATLMAAADVIISKPGPSIVTEAMTMKLPIVALKTPLYAERGNGALIERFKLGREAQSTDDVPALVRQILSQPYQGQPFQSGNVARQIAEFIISKSAPVTRVEPEPKPLPAKLVRQVSTALTKNL